MEGSFTRGIQLYNLERYKQAISYFKDALNNNANDIDSTFYLGLCYYQLNDIYTAQKISESIIATSPNESEGFYLLSMCYYHKEKYDIAIKNIDISIALSPYNSSFFGYKSLILIVLKKYEEALLFANKGLEIDAKDVICLNSRTKALTKLNKKEEAYKTLENTLADNPEDQFTHTNAGWTNLELANYTKANDHFKEALQKDPNDNYAKQGILESIKAKNLVYKYFLKYSFWIQNQKTKNQWFFIIGIYVLYKFGMTASTKLGFNFLTPIIAVIYMSFVFGVWLISPISNSILLFNNFSKYLLDKKDKHTAYSFLFLISVSFISAVLFYFLNENYLLFSCVAFLSAIIPITHTLQNNNKPLTTFNFWYGISIFSLGIINCYITVKIEIIIPIIMFVIFTWFHTLTNKIKWS